MRDINNDGNVYGGIHVNEQPLYVPYNQCTSEVLQDESHRLRGNLSSMSGTRLAKLAVCFVVGMGVLVAGLWVPEHARCEHRRPHRRCSRDPRRSLLHQPVGEAEHG